MIINKNKYNEYKIDVDFLELLDLKSCIFSRIKQCESFLDFCNTDFLIESYKDELNRLEYLYTYISNFIDFDIMI